MLSRNFRLQRVGNISWLKNNYNFSKVSFHIDELVILDVTRGKKNLGDFSQALSVLAEECFVPIASGGGLRDLYAARTLLRSGADKIVLNTALFTQSNLINELASEFGGQSIVASLDYRTVEREPILFTNNGNCEVPGTFSENFEKVIALPVGEIHLNSIQQDGTGQGLDLNILDWIPTGVRQPIILVGGVGNARHIFNGLEHHKVDAVATANLFNFIGDGLMRARKEVTESGIHLPIWD